MALVYSHIMNRMRLWRQKKRFTESGVMTQVCVWAPERSEDLVRRICERVAEPTERGDSLRCVLVRQLNRLRTISRAWSGMTWRMELDGPYVGPYWFMKPIGGRIMGTDSTHVELSPIEAETLEKRLVACCDREISAWLDANKLLGKVRDNTGVVCGTDTPQTLSESRPADEAAFAANEARIAKGIVDVGVLDRTPPMDDPSIIQFEGISGFPSFCQIAHRRNGDRVQIALIYAQNGGTSPTNMFECLATHVRHLFYPETHAAQIDWFDVVPKEVYGAYNPRLGREGMTFDAVSMENACGVYGRPSWSTFDPATDPDWIAFVQHIIDRAQTFRAHAEFSREIELTIQ